ncbi:lysine--tRNA ligase [bacterium]|nr:lysine--tRNA ligase [bacterium]
MTDNNNTDQDDLDHVMKTRRIKLYQIIELGVEPYAYGYQRTHTAHEALEGFEDLQNSEETIRLAGRLVSIRLMGKAAFAHIQDEDRSIQLYFKRDILAEKDWKLVKLLDIGDIIGTEGKLFITRTEERTLGAASITMLSKNLRPLPAAKEKEGQTWHRWADKEEKYRHRSVDLILNRDTRDIFRKRSEIIREIRRFFEDDKGFVEVETPILQPLYGGAAAYPFTTHHQALDRKLYLRIADELYLKRLIVGGINKVYEIAKDFRNEGIDRLHSPEFTMLECYAAYEDYNYCMNLLEELIPLLSEKVIGTKIVKWGGEEINLTPPYPRLKMTDLVREATSVEIVGRTRTELAKDVIAQGIQIEPEWGAGKLIDALFSEKVEPGLIQPTFVVDYPVELSPLAKQHRDNPALVERFELYIGGHEFANSFSELNDPIEQRKRLEEQAKLREAGDKEASPVDNDFLHALEIGMPPTAGLGVGVDRLVMLLTGCESIREVILFPTLREKN